MPLVIVDFLQISSSAKIDLQHLWRDNDGSRHRPKYEVKTGYICLIMGDLGGGVGKTCYCSFVTNVNPRMLDEEDDHDFGENQNPITVQLHISETISRMVIISCYF